MLLLLMTLIGCNRSDRQGYPDRPIKLIVPFSAGGGTDNFARVIKQAIEDNQLLPEPIVIINIDGGGATNGSRRVKNAKPDGYTMLVLHDAILTAKASGMVSYGPEAFELVGATGEVGMVVAVWDRPESHKNLRDLLEDAKKRPNEITFGVNMGALTHYAGLVLQNQMPGAEFRYVQLGGGAKRFASLKGGHTGVTGFSLEEFVRFRPEGVRGLAYFGDERHPAAKDVPTAKEQGFDIVNRNTFYWWVPKGTRSANPELDTCE